MKHRLLQQVGGILSSGVHAFAQAPDGPQLILRLPPHACRKASFTRAGQPTKPITVPAGTRLGVLWKRISTYSATRDPSTFALVSITINNKVVVPAVRNFARRSY